MRVHLALLAVVVTAASSAQSSWEKVMLTEAASKSSAVCLDGSPGGYFLRKGDPKRWIIFQQGGGWCGNSADCAARAYGKGPGQHPWLGGSKGWPDTYVDTYEGSQLFITPPFSTYSVAFVPYCDGGSWTGDAAAPVETPLGKVYYRGRRLLDAMLDSVLAAGLSTATELLYAGCSAGALTTYLHADYVASRMPKQVKVAALADAMFSLDSADVNGGRIFEGQTKWMVENFNSTASINKGCLAANGIKAAYKCFFGANVAPFVQTPVFVLNSKYDTWQGGAIIGANTSIDKLPAKVRDFWVGYGHQMVADVTALPARHGAFISNCQEHCQTGKAGAHSKGEAWMETTINGTTMASAFVQWYNATIAAAAAGDGVSGGVASGAPLVSPLRWVEQCDVDTCGSDVCG